MDTNENTTTDAPTTDAPDDFDILGGYGTDPQAEQEGVWATEFIGGIEVRLRGSQSKEVKAALTRQAKRNARFEKTNTPIPDAITLKNQVEIASAAAADWRRRSTVGGKETVVTTIPYGGQQLACSEDNKKLVFSDVRLWSFRVDVINQMWSLDRFRSAAREDDAGN